MLRKLMIICCFMTVLVAAYGCAPNELDPALVARLSGTWRVNMDRTEPNLRKALADAKARDPELATDVLRAQLLSWMQGRRIVFEGNRMEDWTGGDVETARYEVLSGGENFLVIREFPDDMPEYDGATLQAIVDDIGLINGEVPMCDGIEFIDENHFRLFSLKVRGRKVLQAREYGLEIYERVGAERGE